MFEATVEEDPHFCDVPQISEIRRKLQDADKLLRLRKLYVDRVHRCQENASPTPPETSLYYETLGIERQYMEHLTVAGISCSSADSNVEAE